MPTKQTITLLFSLILLAACSPVLTPPTPSVTHQTSATPVPPTAAPTETPTPTPPPTDMPSPIATPSPAGTPEPTEPVVIVPGLRVAYVIDGNLYVQDSGGQPLQLTSSGIDSSPTLSDDGQKLVFLRKEKSDDPEKGWWFNLYSVNADGGQEQELVSASRMSKFDPKYDQFTELASLAFVPGTHRLLFHTHEYLSYRESSGSHSHVNWDLYTVDTDSAEIRQLLAPGQGGHFGISPNGRLVWVMTPGNSIHVVDLDGKLIYPNLATYPDSWPDWATPYIFWTADSKKLNVIPLSEPTALPGPRVIWQYSMADGSAVHTLFDPPPIATYLSLSPDGNWVAYTYKTTSDDETGFGMYLGNLRNGTTRLLDKEKKYGLPYDYVSWSTDSKYFAFYTYLENKNYTEKYYIGDLSGKFIPSSCGTILGWIDARRYLCGRVVMSDVGKEGLDWVVQIPDDFPHIDEITFVLLKNQAQTGK